MAGPDPANDFEHRHLPGARFVSLDDVLAAPPSGTAGRHPLPSPSRLRPRRSASSASPTTRPWSPTTIAAERFAGRLVWMLRILGQHAALLDGGIAGMDRRAGDDHRARAGRPGTGRTGGARLATRRARRRDRRRRHLADGGVVIDSRDPARYAGELEPIDSVAGHVPGAVNVLFNDNLDADGRFLTRRRTARPLRPDRRRRHELRSCTAARGSRPATTHCDGARRARAATRVRRIVVGLDRRPGPAGRHRHRTMSNPTLGDPR